MKIVIENFGPIRKFEFDASKKLYLIYGENNVGKSYAATLIYLIIKRFRNMVDNNIPGNMHMKDFEFFLNESLKNTFSQNLKDLQNKFSQKELSFSIFDDIFEAVLKLNENILTLDFENFIYCGEKPPFFYCIEAPSDCYIETHFLPASKTGLYEGMSSFNSIFAEFSKFRRSFRDNSIKIPTLTEPMSDYFLKISSIQGNEKSDFAKTIKKLESDVLKGKIAFNKFSKKVEFLEKNTKLKFNLWQTSSMISELSLLTAYLKYVVHKNSLLFIEEPEVHLHPKTQVALMEIFTELANQDLRLFITTHSDFMLQKLTNLILSKKIKPSDVEICHFVWTDEGSIDAKDMKATDEGIEDNNFLEISEQLYNERMKLIK